MRQPWPWRRMALALDAFAEREWRWIVVIAWLLITAWYVHLYRGSIHYFALGDTDDNMRYLQVRDWLDGQSWWDLRQHRLDPPRGASIHWSRLVDLPIAALMLFFRLFTSPGQADRLACGIAPLLPLLPLMLALAFLARRLSAGGHGWLVAMLLPLGANMGLSMFMPLRIDHHGWQLALTATTLAGLVDRKWARGGLIAGVSSAASVAIGMEMLVYLAGAGGLVALRWIFKDGAARRLRPYALGLAGTTAIGYALFASNDNRLPVCDALSPVWTSLLILAGGLLLGLSLLPLRNWWMRLVAAALCGLLLAAFAWVAWPQCLTGAYQISPELQKSWLVYIREAKPITAQARSAWVPMIALPIAGFVCALFGCVAARRDPERLWAWGTVLLMVAFAIGLMFWQIRAGPAAQLLALPPMGWAVWALASRLVRGGWGWRVAAVPGLALLTTAAWAYPLYPKVNRWLNPPAAKAPVAKTSPVVARPTGDKADNRTAGSGNAAANMATNTADSAAAPTTPPRRPGVFNRTEINQANGRCRALPALAPLDQLPPALIFTMVDLGPRLIATTHHSAIAGPYHRNEKAILDVHHAFDGTPERFREIAAAHRATYLLICPGFPEGTIYQQRSVHGFYARLMREEAFDFLTPVTLDYKGTLPYKLFRIAPLPRSAPRGEKVAQQR